MATTQSKEYKDLLDGKIVAENEVNAKLRRFKATITLASQAADSVVELFKVPAGYSFVTGILNASASLATATIKIGTAADDDKYRASAVHTATAPTLFGAQTGFVSGGNSSEEVVRLTTGTAALPASGTLVVDMIFSATK